MNAHAPSPPQSLTSQEEAALGLLLELSAAGYDFVTVTPETHRRVLARKGREADSLRDAFGWSVPFSKELLPAPVFEAAREAGFLLPTGSGWKSAVRVSSLEGGLFLHSAFPTDAEDSVFFGPDSYRFADFIRLSLPDTPGRLADIGAGSGIGGIVAARLNPGLTIELADLNERALSLARVNAAFAQVPVTTIVSEGLDEIEAGLAVVIANPPFMADPSGRTYRSGGEMHGGALSLSWALDAAAKLAPGGTLLLYTGSAIVDGQDGLLDALSAGLAEADCSLNYRELDPDIFGEELDRPGYEQVERIAAVGAVIRKF
jgi:hypothetical protein